MVLIGAREKTIVTEMDNKKKGTWGFWRGSRFVHRCWPKKAIRDPESPEVCCVCVVRRILLNN